MSTHHPLPGPRPRASSRAPHLLPAHAHNAPHMHASTVPRGIGRYGTESHSQGGSRTPPRLDPPTFRHTCTRRGTQISSATVPAPSWHGGSRTPPRHDPPAAVTHAHDGVRRSHLQQCQPSSWHGGSRMPLRRDPPAAVTLAHDGVLRSHLQQCQPRAGTAVVGLLGGSTHQPPSHLHTTGTQITSATVPAPRAGTAVVVRL